MSIRECSHCRGSGKSDCRVCGGYGTMNDGTNCYGCQGNRKVECPACDGKGYFRD